MQPGMNPERFCAYNQTRQRLVVTNVEVADGSGGGAEARLLALGPEGGTTLWISPFRGISPACARFPLDLVYLRDDLVVLDTVEFFPMNVGGQASTQAASVLVLPADTLAQVQIQRGDRLTFSATVETMLNLPRPNYAHPIEHPAAEPVSAYNAAILEQKQAPSAEEVTLRGSADAPKAQPKRQTPLEIVRELPVEAEPLPAPIDKRISEPVQTQMEFTDWAEPASAPDVQIRPVAYQARPDLPARTESRVKAMDHGLDPPPQIIPELPRKPKRAVTPGSRNRRAAAPIEAEAQIENRQATAPSRATESPSTGIPAELPIKKEPSSVPLEANWLEPAATEPELLVGTGPVVARTTQRKPWKKEQAASNWFRRLMKTENRDPRSSPRETLPNLVAYFFTGGTPAPHSVRDISTSGLYLVTRERWYKGTVVQMTLGDRRRSTFDRSIAVYAKAVRLGSDGVGFQFILEGQPGRHDNAIETYAPTNGIDAARVASFVEHYRATLEQVG